MEEANPFLRVTGKSRTLADIADEMQVSLSMVLNLAQIVHVDITDPHRELTGYELFAITKPSKFSLFAAFCLRCAKEPEEGHFVLQANSAVYIFFPQEFLPDSEILTFACPVCNSGMIFEKSKIKGDGLIQPFAQDCSPNQSGVAFYVFNATTWLIGQAHRAKLEKEGKVHEGSFAAVIKGKIDKISELDEFEKKSKETATSPELAARLQRFIDNERQKLMGDPDE